MPALTFRGSKVNLSYSYDTLTIYPNFAEYSEGPQTLQLVMTACYNFAFVLMPTQIPVADTLKVESSLVDLPRRVSSYRAIHRNDDDHALYHHDKFNPDHNHFHLNFDKNLDITQIKQILDVFVQHDVLSAMEEATFLDAFRCRFQFYRTQVDTLLGPIETTITDRDSEVFMQGFLQLIKSIEDNEVLVDLHDYLLTIKFNFLREKSLKDSSHWQGTDASQNVVDTTEIWAKIERALSLQMAHNVEVGSRFTPNLARKKADELSQHRFFSISSCQASFRNARVVELDEEYNSLFSNSQSTAKWSNGQG